MKKNKDKQFDRVFLIREGNKWVAVISHSGLNSGLKGEDKNKEMAVMKLANILYKKLSQNNRKL